MRDGEHSERDAEEEGGVIAAGSPILGAPAGEAEFRRDPEAAGAEPDSGGEQRADAEIGAGGGVIGRRLGTGIGIGGDAPVEGETDGAEGPTGSEERLPTACAATEIVFADEREFPGVAANASGDGGGDKIVGRIVQVIDADAAVERGGLDREAGGQAEFERGSDGVGARAAGGPGGVDGVKAGFRAEGQALGGC